MRRFILRNSVSHQLFVTGIAGGGSTEGMACGGGHLRRVSDDEDRHVMQFEGAFSDKLLKDLVLFLLVGAGQPKEKTR